MASALSSGRRLNSLEPHLSQTPSTAGSVERVVISGAAIGAGVAAGDPVHHGVVVDPQAQSTASSLVSRAATAWLPRRRPEARVRGKPSRIKPLAPSGSSMRSDYDCVDHIVRDELASVHDGFGAHIPVSVPAATWQRAACRRSTSCGILVGVDQTMRLGTFAGARVAPRRIKSHFLRLPLLVLRGVPPLPALRASRN